MYKIFTLKLNHMLKKSLVCATMLGLVVIALASSGGGKKKSSGSTLGIIPIRANGTFTLKSLKLSPPNNLYSLLPVKYATRDPH